MNKRLISDNWTMKIPGDNIYGVSDAMPVTVPGSVYSALLDADAMPDPYYRCNELDALKLMDNDFEFTTSFELTCHFIQCDAGCLKSFPILFGFLYLLINLVKLIIQVIHLLR